MDLQAARDALVEAALPHVPFDGWTMRTLRQAAQAAGYDPTMAQRLFPAGPVGVVDHFNAMADRRMEEALAGLQPTTLRMRQRIALAVRLRLEPWTDDREAVRRALGLLALPQNAMVAARITYRTVDAMWHAVGDTATDFSFYSKRASLAAIYGSTVLYWLDDRSEAAAETWGFLERRLDDLLRMPSLGGAMKRFNPMRLLDRGERRRFRAG